LKTRLSVAPTFDRHSRQALALPATPESTATYNPMQALDAAGRLKIRIWFSGERQRLPTVA